MRHLHEKEQFFLGAEPGHGAREPLREKRIVRFVHPSGLTAHELILARQKELDATSIRPMRSTVEEFGFRAPKLITSRDRPTGSHTARDATYLERRRRVLDMSHSRQIYDISPVHHAETILATRPSGVNFVCVCAFAYPNSYKQMQVTLGVTDIRFNQKNKIRCRYLGSLTLKKVANQLPATIMCDSPICESLNLRAHTCPCLCSSFLFSVSSPSFVLASR